MSHREEWDDRGISEHEDRTIEITYSKTTKRKQTGGKKQEPQGPVGF